MVLPRGWLKYPSQMFPMGEEGTLLNPDFKRHCEIVNAQQPFLEEGAITVYSLISGHHRSHGICPLKRGVHLKKFVRLIEVSVSEEK
jgi:hypothetical protein